MGRVDSGYLYIYFKEFVCDGQCLANPCFSYPHYVDYLNLVGYWLRKYRYEEGVLPVQVSKGTALCVEEIEDVSCIFFCVSDVILLIAIATAPHGYVRVTPQCVAWYNGGICCDMVSFIVPKAVGDVFAVSPRSVILVLSGVYVTVPNVTIFNVAPACCC